MNCNALIFSKGLNMVDHSASDGTSPRLYPEYPAGTSVTCDLAVAFSFSLMFFSKDKVQSS